MPYKYPILRLAVLICFAVIYFSCKQVIQKKSDISISKEDSAILSEIEHFTSYSDFDSALYVIDSLTTIEKYSNSKVFRLKLFENKSRILIRLKRYQDALDNLNLIIAASQKHIDIKLDYVNPNLMIKVMTDKIRRAISNIIINAIKFSHHYKSINIYTTESENNITIHIKDKGIGIPDRIKDNIFISDPISRRLGTDGEVSFGLGLTIVKQLIDEHNGKISFTSNISGTIFSLTLSLYKEK